jgi:hypothetical protein
LLGGMQWRRQAEQNGDAYERNNECSLVHFV